VCVGGGDFLKESDKQYNLAQKVHFGGVYIEFDLFQEASE
jgi:hypothetical protein